MFRRILIPLDGSPLAEEALRRMERLLAGPGTELLLVHVVPRTGMEGAALKLAEAQAEAYLAGLERDLAGRGIRVRTLVRQGPAAESLLEAVDAEKATLVALTTHGRTGLERWAFGSVAEKIVRSSPAPVLVFRSFGPAAPFEPARLLVAVDASGLSREAVAPAARLARRTRGCLLLLHVQDAAHEHVPEPELRAVYDLARQEGVEARPLLRTGDPAAKILEAAAGEKADLIVMTTHGRSGVGRWVLGSVAEKVLRQADRPVLVIRVGPAPLAPAPVPSGVLFA